MALAILSSAPTVAAVPRIPSGNAARLSRIVPAEIIGGLHVLAEDIPSVIACPTEELFPASRSVAAQPAPLLPSVIPEAAPEAPATPMSESGGSQSESERAVLEGREIFDLAQPSLEQMREFVTAVQE